MHTFKKSERLCNYNYKKLLFEKGNFFFCYPFKIQWLIIKNPVENIVLKPRPDVYAASAIKKPEIIEKQNPSFPYRKTPSNALFSFPVKCLISVSSKNHKKATDRNNIKRLIKESYRKNKNIIYSLFKNKDYYCLLAIIYTGKSIPKYSETEDKIILSLQELRSKIKDLVIKYQGS